MAGAEEVDFRSVAGIAKVFAVGGGSRGDEARTGRGAGDGAPSSAASPPAQHHHLATQTELLAEKPFLPPNHL
jgi:hypothetical protein